MISFTTQIVWRASCVSSLGSFTRNMVYFVTRSHDIDHFKKKDFALMLRKMLSHTVGRALNQQMEMLHC